MLFRGHILGKYKVLAPLGSGGFGAVYLARDTWIDKEVAIKVPHRQNLNFTELLREPRLLAALDHPNIVSITTAEKQDDIFFIVMEYIEERRSRPSSRRAGLLSPGRAVEYAAQIGRALDHAHDQGVIHRDLRPANVLVSGAGVLKVADFGTSRFLEIAAHGTTVIGSPAYMAPEQFAGKAVFASDIYSLGVTMYQMLTGVLPYEPPTPNDLDRLMNGDLVRPPRLREPERSPSARRRGDDGARARAVQPLPPRRRDPRRPRARGPQRPPLDTGVPPSGRAGSHRGQRRTSRRRHPPVRASDALLGPLLSAVPQTAPRARFPLPLLRGIAVARSGKRLAKTHCRP